jgi:peptide-methionine (S)-S-oxide reductase
MDMKFKVSVATIVTAVIVLCSACEAQKKKKEDNSVRKIALEAPQGRAIAAFAEGCFWCSEHIFEAVVGIDSAVSGYAGGTTPNPTYELVNTETTGHAETILVYYDPNVIDYAELTNVFFTSHDPTTPDQQGPDKGSSYRSILFYITSKEKQIADEALKRYAGSGMFKKPIVTEIKKLQSFYRAEQYHQDYIEHNPESMYVQNVSLPRYELFKRTYKGRLKSSTALK